MNGFEKRKQKKIEDILLAAFALFREEGIDAVKITDIADRANVSKVSIYNYFGSKEALARQVMFDYMDKKALEFQALMGSDRSFVEKFDQLMLYEASTKDELTDGTNEGLIDNKLILSPQFQVFLHDYAETRIKPLFMHFIEQGKLEGNIDATIDTESIVLYIQSINAILSTPITVKQRSDLGKLMYYGLKGK
jgi:AcrR family transcriptional regulator